MSDFRKLDDQIFASPQISVRDIDAAKALGVTLVINNRPEGEAQDQTPGEQIEAAARAAGMEYLAIPITHSGFSHGQVAAMAEALDRHAGPILAYCRSGTRSTLLWALAQASKGLDRDELAAKAQHAGYDLAPIRPMMDMLAAK